ncbi:MAG: ABC transporter permease [Hyphomicrobiales bacterium]
MARRFDGFFIYAVAFIAFLYAPVLLMPLFSFNDGIFAVFPLKGFTLQHYADMLTNTGMLASLRNSVIVATVVSILSTVIAIPAAIALTRVRLPGGGAILSTMMLPLVIPSIVIAVALLVILVRVLGLPLTLWTVGLGHILVCLPFAMTVIMSRIEGFDRSLEEASRDLGEGAWQTFRRVTLPLALPGVVSSLLLCFITSFDEFVLAFFLSGTQPTLPVYLFSQLRFPNKLPGMLALGSVILVVSAVLVVVAETMRRSETKTAVGRSA